MSLFITFEGVEGSGKTTQIKKMHEFLASTGHSVVLTREPGGTAISDQIRKILLDAENSGMKPLCELLLYAASRAQHIQELVQPALDNKRIVLCDRFTDATLAYQGYARGFSLDLIDNINKLASQNLNPDLTILLDCDPEAGIKRTIKRNQNLKEGQPLEDRFEKEKISFHQKVRDGYLKIASQNPKRFFIVDASQDEKIIHQKIKEKVINYL